jgi:hypothetical protein
LTGRIAAQLLSAATIGASRNRPGSQSRIRVAKSLEILLRLYRLEVHVAGRSCV